MKSKLTYAQWANILSVILMAAMVVAPLAVGAQFRTPDAGGTGLPNDSSLTAFILKIINIALALAGLIAVFFLILGGFRYITSFGNEEATGQAKKIIFNAIIGIVVIILSFVIVRVISNAVARNSI